jgi:hypothetical protein
MRPRRRSESAKKREDFPAARLPPRSRQRNSVQLSILIGTNRTGLLACSRIAQACSWASPNIEVIIRDNSGDAEKRSLLQHFRRDNCTIVLAEPDDSLANITAILKLAKGEFVFILADDDFCFDHAIASIPAVIAECGGDPSVVGITGAYAVEMAHGSAVVDYKNIDSDDPATRVAGFLSYVGPNILHYAPIRRELVQKIFGFQRTQPYSFSFHDQTVSMLYLLNGRFVSLKRFLYLYDLGPWQENETAQQRDVSFYRDAGLDPAINKLHWFICAFEGAALIRNADVFPDYRLAQRQPIADLWFSAMYQRFRNPTRLTYDSKLTNEAALLHAALQKTSGQMSFLQMLTAISGFMALSSPEHAQRYFDFWNAVINKPDAAARPFLAAG